MKNTVVLDKSYLQAISAFEFSSMMNDYRFVMSDSLFYELMTAKPDVRSRCFSKFPAVDDPVILVDHVGVLLRYESNQRRPSAQPSGHRVGQRFRFNAGLSIAAFEFPSETYEALEWQRSDVKRDTERLIGLAEQTPSIFPGLLSGSTEDQAKALRRAEARIARVDAALELYNATFCPHQDSVFPTITGKVSKWAHIRWFQVLLLFATDLHVRYRGRVSQGLTEGVWRRLEHDVHDAQVLVLAALEGGVATNENKLLRWWRVLRPDVRPLTRPAPNLA